MQELKKKKSNKHLKYKTIQEYNKELERINYILKSTKNYKTYTDYKKYYDKLKKEMKLL